MLPTAYKVDTDAIALKVKQEFAAKEKARTCEEGTGEGGGCQTEKDSLSEQKITLEPANQQAPFFCPYFAGFFALFFVAAQRLSCACRILSRASALIARRFAFFFGAVLAIVLAGRPGPRFAGVAVDIKSALAFCSRPISASISATMFSSKAPPRSHQFYQIVSPVFPPWALLLLRRSAYARPPDGLVPAMAGKFAI